MTSMRSQQQPNPFRGSMDENHELPSSTRMANSNLSSMVSQMTGIITPPSQQQQHPSQPQANQLYQQNHHPNNQQYQQQQQMQHQPQYPTQITAQRLQPNPPVNSHEARKAWRLHGTDNSQVLEDRRNNLRSQSVSSPHTSLSPSPSNPEGTGASSIQSVRVSAAENRVDITGASYTTYVMEVEHTHTSTNTHPSHSRITVEHRYSSFLKLHTYLTLHSIHLRSSFPRRSLAGRLGHWTPSTQWAPRAEHELVGYRKIKLDIWLVELAEVVSAGAGVGGRLRAEERERVLLFFRRGDILPCDAVNEIRDGGAVNGNHIRDDGNYLMNYPTAGPSLIAPSYHACHTSCHGHTLNSSPSMSYTPSTSTFRPLNKPISFTLGSEIRKAAHTLRSMCSTW
uniref:PX domain-containing protein n=1 Tax=Proboscia inermis TaxID=420281 RepID=A0A7S0C7I9_9STRA|mmetsp:Transcript_29442/g.29846  ORF Transcript_29442/g.29846 Transcript_29442/m.29846 type:complete len:396 (+) Transcript_29442:321-1508(+)